MRRRHVLERTAARREQGARGAGTDGGRLQRLAVAPLAGVAAGASDDAAVDHQPAADAGSEDDAEDVAVALAGAAGRLGQREAVGVVGDPDRQADRTFEIEFLDPGVRAFVFTFG